MNFDLYIFFLIRFEKNELFRLHKALAIPEKCVQSGHNCSRNGGSNDSIEETCIPKQAQ